MTAPSAESVLAAARTALAGAPMAGSPPYRVFCGELGRLVEDRWDEVISANAQDVAMAERQDRPESIIDRLRLTAVHRKALVELTTAALGGTATGEVEQLAGGLSVRRVARPLGVVLFVYEARPTVTVEGAVLSVATGNAVLLRGGHEIAETNRALGRLLSRALANAGLPEGLVRVLDDPDRVVLRDLLRHGGVDLVVPRGGPSLIGHCQRVSVAPVLASGGGVNHVYVHRSADLGLAADIVLDSKLAEPTACNTVELVLVDTAITGDFLTTLMGRARTGFTLKVPESLAVHGNEWVRVAPLTEHDLGREFLDRTVAVRPVAGLDEALGHIREYGSAHTEGVVATDPAVTAAFTAGVDAAAVVVNGSLRLHDGPTMGLGPEISISTGRLHARGPVTMAALRTYTWLIDGRGALRGATGDER